MVGVDAALCCFVEDTMKQTAKRIKLDAVPGTSEEWLVPLTRFPAVHAAVIAAVTEEHAPAISTAANVPRELDRELELAKHKVDAEATVKKHALDGKIKLLETLINSGDPILRDRAVAYLGTVFSETD
jgi:hypothetical protein